MNKKYYDEPCKYCDSTPVAKGMCNRHYQKWRRVGGDESKMLTHGNSVPIEDRIKEYSVSNGCWLWNKGLNHQGYGKIKYNGRTMGVHVVSYFLRHGEWPNTELDHVCHTLDESCSGGVVCQHRRCINPEHLEPVGNRENTRRRDLRIGLDQNSRIQKPILRKHLDVCGKGHEYTQENTRITPKGHRSCRQCAREYVRERRRGTIPSGRGG
jgi:hypothetical protein